MKPTRHGMDLTTLSRLLGLAFQTTALAPLLQILVPMLTASLWTFLGTRSA
jgi:hypothetical protein